MSTAHHNPKICITGITGLLGSALHQTAPSHMEISGLYNPSEPKNQQHTYYAVDITDFQRVREIIKRINPDTIIHTAAQGNLDWCEEHPAEADIINTQASINLAKIARETAATFVFVSSNAVFDGTNAPYKAESTTNPVNVYGKTKAEVEKWISGNSEHNMIIRPSLMFGWPNQTGRDNQVTRTIMALRQGESIGVVNDTYFSPISAQRVANSMWHILEQRRHGIHNIGSKDRISLFDLAIRTAEIFNLSTRQIYTKSVKDSPAIAPRSIDTSFDPHDMHQTTGIEPTSVDSDLHWMKTHEPATQAEIL